MELFCFQIWPRRTTKASCAWVALKLVQVERDPSEPRLVTLLDNFPAVVV